MDPRKSSLPFMRALPALPASASSSTPSTKNNTTDSPMAAEFGERASSSSSSSKRLSMQPSKRASNVPRPAPIPLPEPVSAAHPTGTTDSSGEGPSSTSSGDSASALALVSPELLQHITITADARPSHSHSHSHAASLSPSSPQETNRLLTEGSTTPIRSSSSPRVVSDAPLGVRPHSALVEPSSTRRPPSSYEQASRPYSSADVWSHTDAAAAANATSGLGSLGSRSQSPSVDSLLRPGQMPRSRSTNNFMTNTPSPLNPNVAPGSTPIPTVQRRPGSASSRPASMVLYRLAGVGDDFNPPMSTLTPPMTTNSRRASRFSTISSSQNSIFSDSKYPNLAREEGSLTPPPSGAFLPYEYDPSWDQDLPDDAEDALHRPDEPGKKERIGGFNLRGACNIFVMVTILLLLITLFVAYPVISYYDRNSRTSLFVGTDNGSTSGNDDSETPNSDNPRSSEDLVDPDTPDDVKQWTSPVDGTRYSLVFSDEFDLEGRQFQDGQDPFWEAVDLHDAKNLDLNWYSPDQVTTKDGYLVISLEEKASNGYNYASGMIQSWNKLCFTGGYVEISVSLPGSASDTGLTPQAYTMGNLARSGYGASEAGLLPYSYDICDQNILPFQNGFTESTLPAQRLSACTCPDEFVNGEHPGPVHSDGSPRGRGAPQIDIFHQLSTTAVAGTVTQGYRVAPFNVDRTANPGTIMNAGEGELNSYTGGTTQQLLSALTNVPSDAYESSGGQFTSFGYEHIADEDDPTQSSLHWIKEGDTEVYRITADALAADDTVPQRLVSEEPMYIVLSLALSQVVRSVDVTSLTFPAKMLVDYVRVYQREEDDQKITCDPTDMPTADYIERHSTAYTDATLTTWAAAGYDDPTEYNTFDCVV